MGRPKPLLELDGQPLILRHLSAMRVAAREIVVVTGSGAGELRAVLPPEILTVHNDAWQHTHPLDSLRLALLARPWRGPVLVSPVDVLPAAPETLQKLLSVPAPAVPCSGEADGHPVLLGREQLSQIRAGEPAAAQGLRGLLRGALRVQVEDALVGLDFDDESAWREVRARRAAITGETL
jgi:CTP:molybdopterin cytidylyltransferase MocA